MNRQEEEAVTDISGGSKKKRKKYVFLDKHEEFKTSTNTNIRLLYVLQILQMIALVAACMYK